MMSSKLVPEVRFKEFSGEWESKKLEDISDIVRGGSPRPIDYYMTLAHNGLNWLKIADVDKNSKYVIHTKEKVKKSALNKTREVDIGNLILSNSMSFGRPYIMKIKSCIHDGWIAVTHIQDNISNDYLYYLILSPTSQKFFIDYAAGGGIRNLNADIIKSLPIAFPKSQNEQQKIADTFSSLDNLIEAQTKKVELLKSHKKGLMQKLFPRDGAKVPEVRFKEFSGEWEEKKLGDDNLIEFYNGKAHEKSISDNGKYIVINSKFISTDGLIKKYSDELYMKAEINDITMVMSDVPNGKAIAKCFLINTNNTYTVNQRICILRPKKINSIFLFYILNRNKYYLSFDDGVKQTNLKKDDVLSCPLKIPKDEQEQQKIANTLSSLDNLIVAETKKIELLKEHKKGLMQKMFVSKD